MNKPPSKKKIEQFKRIERECDIKNIHLKTDLDYKFPPILRNNGKIEWYILLRVICSIFPTIKDFFV